MSAICSQCREAAATVYAVDPHPGGWGGRYCEPCAERLRFQVVDRLRASHTPEVAVSLSKERPYRKRYRGSCSCGWKGMRSWGTSLRAMQDATRHTQDPAP